MLTLMTILFLFLIIVQPLITIWALNTIFTRLAIPYTFSTWLATVWLTAIVGGASAFMVYGNALMM